MGKVNELDDTVDHGVTHGDQRDDRTLGQPQRQVAQKRVEVAVPDHKQRENEEAHQPQQRGFPRGFLYRFQK